MTKMKVILFGVVALIAIVALLMYNKSKRAAAITSDKKLSYFVTVEKAAKKNPNMDLSFLGTTAPYNDVNVASEVQGKIVEANVKVGDYVQAGTVLFRVDDELKKAALLTAQANYDKAKADLQRTKALHEQKSVPDAQLDAAQLQYSAAEAQLIVAKRQLADTKIVAPFSGVINNRMVDAGAWVNNGNFVANIVDVSRLKVKINVSETMIAKLKKGAAVSITSDAVGSDKFTGVVDAVGVKGDEAHTFPVEIIINNYDKNKLKAGMFVRATFTGFKAEEGIFIPRAAIIGSLKNPQVYVVTNGVATLRDITTGIEMSSLVQVVSGIAEGESVVISGQNTLENNAKVELQ